MVGSSQSGEVRLILGLGNPGERYRDSRHNRGREVVEELAVRRHLELEVEECGCRIAVDSSLILAIPETFMNRSGFAARCLLETRNLRPKQMMAVYDDVALPLGALRLRVKGGPGGQKGMASLIENLRTEEIPRLRLGIAPATDAGPDSELSDFVLSGFGADEIETAAAQIQRAADACETWVREGAEVTMNQFNSPELEESRKTGDS